jgi:hypothetical protein
MVCELLPISEDGCHYAWIATTVEDRKNHERFFVRCVSNQKISHREKAQRPRSKIGADMANQWEWNKGANRFDDFY